MRPRANRSATRANITAATLQAGGSGSAYTPALRAQHGCPLLGGEEIERVVGPLGEAQAIGHDLPRLRIVNAAQIDDQTAVDVNEHVIVAAEVEIFAAAIGEDGVDLDGERIVVRVPLVADEEMDAQKRG